MSLRPQAPQSLDRPTRLAERYATLVRLGLEPAVPRPVVLESGRIDRGVWKLSLARPAMGTVVAVTVLHGSRTLCEEAAGRAYEEMDRLIGVFDRYAGDSALGALNSAGRLDGAPDELVDVVRAALSLYGRSGGAFDATVQPLVDLLRLRLREQGRPPDRGEIDDALERTGSRHVEIAGRRIALRRPGMGLTLDGIAKGYIVDGMAVALRHRGVRRYLINAGGDIRTGGGRDDGSPWTVAVKEPPPRDPAGAAAGRHGPAAGRPGPHAGPNGRDDGESRSGNRSGDFHTTLRLRDSAVATSGGYEIYFDADGHHHHIVEATTGDSPRAAAGTTVLANDAMSADAVATAAFVMGPRRGIRFIGSLPRCEGMVVAADGTVATTDGWPGGATPRGPTAPAPTTRAPGARGSITTGPTTRDSTTREEIQ